MDQLVSVILCAPVKIGGKARRVGETVAVSLSEAAQLEAMGVIEPIAPGVSVADLAPGAPGFDEAVAAAARELAGQAFDGALAKLEAEVKQIVAEAESLEAEKGAALARLADAEARVDLLQAQLAEATAPQAETVEQTETGDAPPKAPKKAAAAKKKG